MKIPLPITTLQKLYPAKIKNASSSLVDNKGLKNASSSLVDKGLKNAASSLGDNTGVKKIDLLGRNVFLNCS